MLNIESMFAGNDDSFETGKAVKTYLVALENIVPSDSNFYPADDEGIRCLADLIEAVGLIHPLSAIQEGYEARLVSGERRYRAMKLLCEEGRKYTYNGRDITGRAPVTYMPGVYGAKEKLTIAAANASRDLTNEEKNRIIDEVTEAIESEEKTGRFKWPKGRRAHTLSVYTGIREHYIKEYLARSAGKEEEQKKEQTAYSRTIRFLSTAEKKVRQTEELMKQDLTPAQKMEIRRKAALLCTRLEDLLTEEDTEE